MLQVDPERRVGDALCYERSLVGVVDPSHAEVGGGENDGRHQEISLPADDVAAFEPDDEIHVFRCGAAWLSDGPASAAELAARLGSDPNGHLSTDLKELVEAGFVAASVGLNPQTGRPSREVRYRLKDNYTRFYLKYVLPKRTAIESGVFWYVSLERLPGWDTIMGLQFENFVLNNFQLLAKEIGLVGKNVESVAPYFRRGGKCGPGVQIDMLVQLPKCVYIVEIKRKGRIAATVVDDVQRKIERLALPERKSVKTVLVYAGELEPSIEEDGFFDYLVPAEKILVRN